ncbi:MAG: hypothetical protein J0L78_15540 [Planctomycetes bacterium]|nr:hypothetical protein [Planctomycetota bacterium]
MQGGAQRIGGAIVAAERRRVDFGDSGVKRSSVRSMQEDPPAAFAGGSPRHGDALAGAVSVPALALRLGGEVCMVLRLGDLLVRQGVLTEQQVEDILIEQRAVGRPFGELAERLFGVSPQDVERAWAEQYSQIAGEYSLHAARFESDALASITARQAWQFRVLPVRFSGDELTVCTTKDHLARALRFVGWKIQSPCHFVLAGPEELAQGLMKHFPLAGASVGMVTGKTIGAV